MPHDLDSGEQVNLARNPMQLAILLALISVQGASLPDKRTALYDNYIEIFLNRESEKSAIVRDHRELLIQIHRYLAWTLQIEAETSSGAGNIAESRLRDNLRTFLESSGHETKLIDKLFTGMVERVVALVSRVQGTFEFEVQPLREYFAARYLYDTAPYAPAGTARRGTLPDRFDAIARNFYWLNVARFYAGCYNSGELASLLDGLEEIQSTDQFRYVSNIPQLGATLLSDYVFSQQPKLITKLASRVTNEPHFRILLAKRFLDYSQNGLSLPEGPARTTLIDTCKNLLAKRAQFDTRYALSQTLIANCSGDEILEYWKNLRQKLDDDKLWIRLGGTLRVFNRLPIAECVSILATHGGAAMLELQRYDRADVFDASPQFWDMFFELILDGAHYSSYSGTKVSDVSIAAMTVGTIITYLSENSVDVRGRRSFQSVYRHRVGSQLFDGGLAQVFSRHDDAELPLPRQFVDKIDSNVIKNFDLLGSSLSHWSEIVELGRSIWGERWAFYKMSITAAKNVMSMTVPECGLFDEMVPLCERSARARLNRGNSAWWHEQLVIASETQGLALPFVLLALHTWMPVKATLQLSVEISTFIDGLSVADWGRLANSANLYRGLRVKQRRRQSVALKKSELPDAMSPRLACLLASRVTPATARQIQKRYLADYVDEDFYVLMASATAVAEEAYNRSNYWARALPVISFAYNRGADPFQFRRNVDGAPDIPIAEARAICANAGLYPLSLVGHAESVLATRTGAEAIPVGKIAARDEWFVED